MAVTFAPATESTAGGVKLPAGKYLATPVDIEEVESQFSDSTRYKWVWQIKEIQDIKEYPDGITDENADEYYEKLMNGSHWFYCSNSMAARAKLRKWLSMMLDRAIVTGEQPDPNDVLNKDYTITVAWEEHNMGGTGKTLTITHIEPVNRKPKLLGSKAKQPAESRPWDTGAGAVPGF